MNNSENLNDGKGDWVKRSVLIALIQPLLKCKALDTYDKVILTYMLSRFGVITKDYKPWQFSASDISKNTCVDRHTVSRRLKTYLERDFVVQIGTRKLGLNIIKAYALKPSHLESYLSKADGAGSTTKCDYEALNGNDGIGSTKGMVLAIPQYGAGSTKGMVLGAPLESILEFRKEFKEESKGIIEVQSPQSTNAYANVDSADFKNGVFTSKAAVGEFDPSNNIDCMDTSKVAVAADIDITTKKDIDSELDQFGLKSISSEMSTALGASVANPEMSKLSKGNKIIVANPSRLAVSAELNNKPDKDKVVVSDTINGSAAGVLGSGFQAPEHLSALIVNLCKQLDEKHYLPAASKKHVLQQLLLIVKNSSWVGKGASMSEINMDQFYLRDKFNALCRLVP
jgi:hypothetical protein